MLVVAGGITTTSHPETPTATVEVFLSSKDKWISMDNMMQPRSWYPSLVITNKRLACVGGKVSSILILVPNRLKSEYVSVKFMLRILTYYIIFFVNYNTGKIQWKLYHS